jgi:hypothetical protein
MIRRPLVVLAALTVALVGCQRGCQRVLPVHPGFGIELTRGGDGQYVASFWNCLNDAELPLNEVAIYRAGDGPKGLPAICKLRSTKYGQLELKRWEYGSAPPGYKLISCTPLEVGQEYDLHASGSGIGVRRFQLRQDGSVEDLEPACR